MRAMRSLELAIDLGTCQPTFSSLEQGHNVERDRARLATTRPAWLGVSGQCIPKPPRDTFVLRRAPVVNVDPKMSTAGQSLPIEVARAEYTQHFDKSKQQNV